MRNKTLFAIRLQQLRKARGLTQKQLAEQSRLSYNSIIGYENGRSEPNCKALVSLEKIFNVSGSYFYE